MAETQKENKVVAQKATAPAVVPEPKKLVFNTDSVSGVYKTEWAKGAKDRVTLAERVLKVCLSKGIKTAAGKTPDLEFVKRQCNLLISDVKIANKSSKNSILKDCKIIETAETEVDGKKIPGEFKLVLK